MAHSDMVSVIGPALETYMISNMTTLGLRKVWYGDDDSIPETPALLITPSTKGRELTNTGHTTLNTFRFALIVFHSSLNDPTVVRKDCDSRAEQVESILHANKRLDGILLHSYVQSMEFGAATRGTTVMKATRLLWFAQSQTRI